MKKTLSILMLLITAQSIIATPSNLQALATRLARATIVAGACYWGLTQDGQKTRTTVWQAAEKIMQHSEEAASKAKNWLNEKFNEQKDDHAIMLKTLHELKKEIKVLKRQNALLLDKAYALEAKNNKDLYFLPGESPFLTEDEQANEKILTRRGFTIMETE